MAARGMRVRRVSRARGEARRQGAGLTRSLFWSGAAFAISFSTPLLVP